MKRRYLALFALLCLAGAQTLFAQAQTSFVNPDECFISEEPFTDQDWIYASLAKQLKAPTAASKLETQVQKYSDGKPFWTKNAWKTKLAEEKDLVVGAVVIILDARDGDGLYRAPESRAEALDNYWFLARITDLSDLYKDVVTVSGGYQVQSKALRITVKQ